MKSRMVVACLAATSAFLTPAHADVTYKGSFKGVVTHGYAIVDFFGLPCSFCSRRDLAGQLIDITFTSTVYRNHANSGGQLQAGLIESFGYAGNTTFGVYSNGTNDAFQRFGGSAAFGGSDRTGVVSIDQPFFPDRTYNFLDISYDAATGSDGPLSGFGSAQNDRPGFSGPSNLLDFSFTLLRGSVTAIQAGAVPEPATWTLMTAAFALAGAAMRRKARRDPLRPA